MRTAVIVVAAGRSERFGSDTPKQFAPVRGRPLLFYSLHAFETIPLVEAVVAVVPEGRQSFVQQEIVGRFALRKVGAVVAGGAKRQDSVWAGLRAVPPWCELVAVHDCARPLLNTNVVTTVLAAAERFGAAIPVLPVHDTIKEACQGEVVRTLERDRLVAVQTPQAFHYSLLLEAYRAAQAQGIVATDDAALVEKLGHSVRVVAGDPRTIKVTTAHDLVLVEQWLAQREEA